MSVVLTIRTHLKFLSCDPHSDFGIDGFPIVIQDRLISETSSWHGIIPSIRHGPSSSNEWQWGNLDMLDRN